MKNHSFVFLLLFSCGLFAQVVQDSARIEPLAEVTISNLHVNDSLMRAPAAIAIIQASQLQRGDKSNISTAINRTAGVMMQSGTLNTNRISIRGIGARTPFGTNKIRAFYGSIPLTSGDSETTIEDLDLASLSRAEIIKGPLSSVYGAGLGGAILLTPENANGTNAAVSTVYGSYGLRKFNATASAEQKSASIKFNYHTLDTDGWRQNNRYHREGQTISGELFRRENSQLSYLANHTFVKAYIPSSINKEMFENNPRAAAPTWLASKGFEQYDSYLAGLDYHFTIGKIRNQSSVFFNSKNSNEPRPFDVLRQKTTGYGARTQFSRQFESPLDATFIVGAEVFYDRFNGRTYENLYQQNNGGGSLQGEKLSEAEQQRSFYNAFAQLRLKPLRKFALQAGLNVNQTRFSLDNVFPSASNGKYKYDVIWSPQISMLYLPNNDRTVYASISRGFSLPSVAETLTATGTINTNIKPEIGTNFEIGAKYYFLGRRIYTEVTLYHMEIRDLLVAKRVGDDQYVGINAGRTTHRGIEWLAKYRSVFSEWIFECSVWGSTGDYVFKDFIDGNNDFTGNHLPGVPNTRLGSGISVHLKSGWYISGDFSYTGKMPMNDANTDYNDEYSLIDIETGWNWSPFRHANIRLSAGVNNVGNARYASMILVNATAVGNAAPRYYYPGMPSHGYGCFSFSWEF
jgi:iron complex outermembrane recepter protein